MKPRAKFISFLLAFVMTFQLFCSAVPQAFAADAQTDTSIIYFQDVLPDAPWYDAVYFLAHAGILNGVAENEFAPSVHVTTRQVVATARRLLQQDASGEYFSGDMTKDAILNLIIPASMDPDTALTQQMAVNILFRTLGCLPACNSHSNQIYEESGGFDFAVNILSDMKLLDRLPIDIARRDDLITRGEYALLLKACYDLLHDEEYASVLTTCGFGYIPIEATEKFAKHIPGTVGYMTIVPHVVLRAYHNSGYKVVLDNARTEDYAATHDVAAGSTIVGLFVVSQKAIYITTPYAIMHEMGHFVERFMVGVGDIEPCFKADKDSCGDILGVYSETNHREFFGESFRFFIQNRNDMMQMDLMRGSMPSTYQYFLDLEANNYVKPKA